MTIAVEHVSDAATRTVQLAISGSATFAGAVITVEVDRGTDGEWTLTGGLKDGLDADRLRDRRRLRRRPARAPARVDAVRLHGHRRAEHRRAHRHRRIQHGMDGADRPRRDRRRRAGRLVRPPRPGRRRPHLHRLDFRRGTPGRRRRPGLLRGARRAHADRDSCPSSRRSRCCRTSAVQRLSARWRCRRSCWR